MERQSDQNGDQTQLDGARRRGRQRSADDGHAQGGGGSTKTLQLLVFGRRRVGGPGRRRYGAHALGEKNFRGNSRVFFVFLILFRIESRNNRPKSTTNSGRFERERERE